MENGQFTWIAHFIWGIADDVFTYVWVLTNRKPEQRTGRVQLIDASQWYKPLRLKGIDPEREYSAKEIKTLRESAERAEDAPLVIKKIHKPGAAPDPLRGLFQVTLQGKQRVVEYEPDTEIRDSEQIPFLECPACREPGYLPSPDDQRTAIEGFLRREVLPYAPDAWYNPASVKVGYEVNFNRYFYKPKALRSLEEISTDLLAVE